MTPPGDLSLPPTPSVDLAIADVSNRRLPLATVDLVFTQDAAGHYLSFYWQSAEEYGFKPESIVGESLEGGFCPLQPAFYLNRLRRVLDYLIPEHFTYPFEVNGHILVFELTASPILVPQGLSTTAIVTGQFQRPVSRAEAVDLVNYLLHSPPTTHPASNTFRYQKLLTQVAWNIRRTLDLETIWQQTVDGLGRAVEVDRCLLCPYEVGSNRLKIVAEYRQMGHLSMLGEVLLLEESPPLKQALTILKPVVTTTNDGSTAQSLLFVPTCYQDQPNGVIVLYQGDRSCLWNQAEIDLIRELADQVGTGIAHATLFSNSLTLASELRRANETLVQKHTELELARKQAEEASRLKSEFLANTSHELRTPLNGMIGFLKLVMDGMADDPVEQNEFIEEAYRSAVHLLGIINDILDIAKIEAGKMSLDLNPVKLDDLLSDVENFTRTQAQQKNLSFEIRTPATRDDVILLGNYQRLLQVMLNLVGNAIKFTHEGGITITAEVLPKKIADDGQELPSMVKISVADTGIGVSLEKQDKLFQSFSQVDGSRTRQYGGTGLGLAISQKLVEAMEGIVNFYSMGEGLGSTVTFTVPLYQDPVLISDRPTLLDEDFSEP